MPVNYNAAVVDDVVSVWVKLSEEVRGKVIEATNQLLTVTKQVNKDSTEAEVSGAMNKMNELYGTLPAEVQHGVRETLVAITRNAIIEE
jgi:hypothetical protein